MWGRWHWASSAVALALAIPLSAIPLSALAQPSSNPLEATPEAALQRAQKVVVATRQSLSGVRGQLADARSARDVVKALCLTDKVRQLEIAQRAAGDRLAALQTALGAGQIERGRHELVVLEALGSRAKAAAGEASECVGEEASNYDSQANATLAISPLVPDADPSSSVLNPFGAALSRAALGPDSISPPPVVASPLD